jgi:hypothetical protein
MKASASFRVDRHCEERSDEAIQGMKGAHVPLDRVASLAMTAIRQL